MSYAAFAAFNRPTNALNRPVDTPHKPKPRREVSIINSENIVDAIPIILGTQRHSAEVDFHEALLDKLGDSVSGIITKETPKGIQLEIALKTDKVAEKANTDGEFTVDNNPTRKFSPSHFPQLDSSELSVILEKSLSECGIVKDPTSVFESRAIATPACTSAQAMRSKYADTALLSSEVKGKDDQVSVAPPSSEPISKLTETLLEIEPTIIEIDMEINGIIEKCDSPNLSFSNTQISSCKRIITITVLYVSNQFSAITAINIYTPSKETE
ncbi:hypothetical protein BDB01DRAFT_836024 [Pilobolus umbonatus]|nr:hypothetical protein BDB01DRAFT_836024 [Pilobolus umbonatus]